MAKIYDISMKITNELPAMKITDEILVTVNNRHSTILNIQAMIMEAEKKESDETEIMDKALNLLIGEKKTEEINALDLPINEFKEVYAAIMKVAQGIDIDAEETPSEQ